MEIKFLNSEIMKGTDFVKKEQPKKAMGFAPDLVPLIKDGSKALTYRLDDKYSFLEVGNTLMVRDSSTDEIFAEIQVTAKSWTTFGELPIDRPGHEFYASREAQREKFKEYYRRDIQDSDEAIILGFKVLRLIEK